MFYVAIYIHIYILCIDIIDIIIIIKIIYIYIRYSAYMCQAQTGKLDLTSAAAALHRFEVLAYLLQMSFSHT